jgi:acyl-coenzyme A synthetase/AMP-(fatty) acid ligase
MKKFTFEDFLRHIQQHRITHLQVVPPILIMLKIRSETSNYDLSSLQNILCGAAPLSRELQNSIQDRFKVNVIQGWGMTELTCGAIHVPGGLSDDSGSVGRLHPNCECMLIDEEGNNITETGGPGEMVIKGPQVCLEYWRNNTATTETFLDSSLQWLKTGDVAVLKNDWFWIVDRKKELIKVNGLQVAPAELEAILLEHDSIADAAVVGISRNDKEFPMAYVSLKAEYEGSLSAKDVERWVAARVAKHKQLLGGVRFVASVPRLASGKIERKVIRAWAKRDSNPEETGLVAKL